MEAVLFIIFIMMFGAIVDSLPKKIDQKMIITQKE